MKSWFLPSIVLSLLLLFGEMSAQTAPPKRKIPCTFIVTQTQGWTSSYLGYVVINGKKSMLSVSDPSWVWYTGVPYATLTVDVEEGVRTPITIVTTSHAERGIEFITCNSCLAASRTIDFNGMPLNSQGSTGSEAWMSGDVSNAYYITVRLNNNMSAGDGSANPIP